MPLKGHADAVRGFGVATVRVMALAAAAGGFAPRVDDTAWGADKKRARIYAKR